MKKQLKIIIAFGLIFLTGCFSEPKRVNLIHIHEAKVYEDPKSVFYSNDNLHESNLPRANASKIKLPEKVKIAVIKLEPRPDSNDYREYQINKNFEHLQKNDTASYLMDLLNESPENFRKHKMTSVLVPQSLIPAKADFNWIKKLGATMQANLVLVIDSRNDRARENEVVKRSEVLSMASADVYLVDTKSGAIISTKSYTKESFMQKGSSDFNIYETLGRARADSEKKIYKKLASDIKDALDTASQ